jgi:hypothetical protein
VLADRVGCLKAGVVANVVVPSAEYMRFAAITGSGLTLEQGETPDPFGYLNRRHSAANAVAARRAPNGAPAAQRTEASACDPAPAGTI